MSRLSDFVSDLRLALFTQDCRLVRRNARRMINRLQIVRDLRSPFPLIRDSAVVVLGAFGLFFLWVLIFVGIPLFGAWLHSP